MAKAKVGDRVWFKNDVEGYGVVVEVKQERGGWDNDWCNFYLISNTARNCEPWHPMARMSYDHGCTVVYCDEDQIELD